MHDLAPHLVASYRSLAPESRPASVRYKSSLGTSLPLELLDPTREPDPDDVELLEVSFLNELSEMRQREIERGVCLVGPHRDDLELILGDQPAKGFASHGESWSFALSMRLGAFLPAAGRRQRPGPDARRRVRRTGPQAPGRSRGRGGPGRTVLITAAVAEDVPAELSATRFGVEAHDTERGRLSQLTAPRPNQHDGRRPMTGEQSEPQPEPELKGVDLARRALEEPARRRRRTARRWDRGGSLRAAGSARCGRVGVPGRVPDRTDRDPQPFGAHW